MATGDSSQEVQKMAEEHEVDPGDAARMDVRIDLGPIDIPTWKSPPPADPCACPANAVHRTGLNEPGGQGVGLGSLPPGSVVPPPLAQLYLPPGSYAVSANFSVTSNFGGGGVVFAYLGTRNQGNTSWAWLRMPNHGAPGDSQVVHLQSLITLTAGDWLGVDAAGGAQNAAFLASDIWLIAQKVGISTVQTL
jgi:hypothetical protein